MTEQDRIFATAEGDAWFRRNRLELSSRRGDPLFDLLGRLPEERREAIRSICDVGCSNADRLARFAPTLGNCSRVAGFDASVQAIADGALRYPSFELLHGLADEPPVAGPFDLVTVSFVLHWVDRSRIARAVAAIDNLIAKDGFLLLADFLPDRQCARRYHHRQDVELFTYKQDYAAAFLGLGLYREIARGVFAHDAPGTAVSSSDDQNRACAVLLEKTCEYPLVST